MLLSPMTVTLTIPDELTAPMSARLGEPGQAALEALAARAYEQGALSLEQVRRLLNLPSRWEAQNLLSSRGVWPGTTVAGIEADLATLGRLFPVAG